MNVLILSPYPGEVERAVISGGDRAIVWNEKIDVSFLRERQIDWIVSYGYRFLIREPVLSEYAGRIINLHISFLPWNRGSDPNFWSWFSMTPSGVSIHQIDAGMDTGPILVQEESGMTWDETLASSYAKLRSQIEVLFARRWAEIRVQRITPQPQTAFGSVHRHSEFVPLFARLRLGYDTNVMDVHALNSVHFAA